MPKSLPRFHRHRRCHTVKWMAVCVSSDNEWRMLNGGNFAVPSLSDVKKRGGLLCASLMAVPIVAPLLLLLLLFPNSTNKRHNNRWTVVDSTQTSVYAHFLRFFLQFKHVYTYTYLILIWIWLFGSVLLPFHSIHTYVCFICANLYLLLCLLLFYVPHSTFPSHQFLFLFCVC